MGIYKKSFEAVTDTNKTTCKNLTKTITQTSITNNKASESLTGKVLEVLNDKGMMASYLTSSLIILLTT